MKNLKLNVYLNSSNDKLLVGKLTHYNKNIYFEYDHEFIKTGIEISPFHLPLQDGIQTEDKRIFGGIHGVFNDSLPDGWGMLLMDRYFRKIDVDPFSASPLERLAYIGQRALGALSYEPHHDINYKWNSTLSLENLAADCEKILHGNENDILPELIIAGGSPGGARPKVIVKYNEKSKKILVNNKRLEEGYSSYLIKFATMIDINDIPEVEYAYSLMAKDCGIVMPQTKLFHAGRFGNAFGIERFDISDNSPIHVHTLSGLLHADYRMPNLDYTDYLKATWLLTQSMAEVKQAYKRMVFNVLTHNRDDHSKNFSFILSAKKWQLSPAYDLTFSSGIAGEHTMTIAGEGANPRMENLLNVAKRLDIKTAEATIIIKKIKNITDNWIEYANIAAVKPTVRKKLLNVFKNISL